MHPLLNEGEHQLMVTSSILRHFIAIRHLRMVQAQRDTELIKVQADQVKYATKDICQKTCTTQVKEDSEVKEMARVCLEHFKGRLAKQA